MSGATILISGGGLGGVTFSPLVPDIVARMLLSLLMAFFLGTPSLGIKVETHHMNQG